jgi:hypothetical protein
MKDWHTHWRDDRKLMERICPHGVGHPDPDDLAYKKTVFEKQAKELFDNEKNRKEYVKDLLKIESIHGCDGCCNPKRFKNALNTFLRIGKKEKEK